MYARERHLTVYLTDACRLPGWDAAAVYDGMAEILKYSGIASTEIIQCAARIINGGKVVAFPTDTVYGLGADPFNLAAVSEVFRVKGRSFNRPLPLLVNSLDHALELTHDPPRLFFDLARKYWPGPLTIIVPASSRIPLKVTSNTGNVGLRWPHAEVALALIRAAGCPLTGTSANLTDLPACRTAAEVNSQLGDALDMILDGGASGGETASTVVDLTGSRPRVVRHGKITEEELKEFFD